MDDVFTHTNIKILNWYYFFLISSLRKLSQREVSTLPRSPASVPKTVQAKPSKSCQLNAISASSLAVNQQIWPAFQGKELDTPDGKRGKESVGGS